MRHLLSFTLLCVIGVGVVALADVRVEPRFGSPHVFSDRIVFTSVDGKHVIGIDKQGHAQWEVAFPVRVFLQKSGDQLLVQSGREVYRLDPSNGSNRMLKKYSPSTVQTC